MTRPGGCNWPRVSVWMPLMTQSAMIAPPQFTGVHATTHCRTCSHDAVKLIITTADVHALTMNLLTVPPVPLQHNVHNDAPAADLPACTAAAMLATVSSMLASLARCGKALRTWQAWGGGGTAVKGGGGGRG